VGNTKKDKATANRKQWCKAIQQSRPADYHPRRLVVARQPDDERDIAAGESAQG